MSDALYFVALALFALLTWGLLVLCERLMRGSQ